MPPEKYDSNDAYDAMRMSAYFFIMKEYPKAEQIGIINSRSESIEDAIICE